MRAKAALVGSNAVGPAEDDGLDAGLGAAGGFGVWVGVAATGALAGIMLGPAVPSVAPNPGLGAPAIGDGEAERGGGEDNGFEEPMLSNPAKGSAGWN